MVKLIKRSLRGKRTRHLLYKTGTWALISWVSYVIMFALALGDSQSGLMIGTGMFILKTIMYYIHDQIWYNKIMKKKKKRVCKKCQT